VMETVIGSFMTMAAFSGRALRGQCQEGFACVKSSLFGAGFRI
jgi:hypothetical protein